MYDVSSRTGCRPRKRVICLQCQIKAWSYKNNEQLDLHMDEELSRTESDPLFRRPSVCQSDEGQFMAKFQDFLILLQVAIRCRCAPLLNIPLFCNKTGVIWIDHSNDTLDMFQLTLERLEYYRISQLTSKSQWECGDHSPCQPSIIIESLLKELASTDPDSPRYNTWYFVIILWETFICDILFKILYKSYI